MGIAANAEKTRVAGSICIPAGSPVARGLHERIRSAVELSVSGMARGLFWRPSVVGKDDAGSVGLGPTRP